MGNATKPLTADKRGQTEPFDPERFFGVQTASSRDLPDPEPMLVNLARCVLEVLAGARELDQMMRWVTDDVNAVLLRREVLARRAREVKGVRAYRPQVVVLSTRWSSPRDGVVEGVVVVRTQVRVRAIALRLEGLDRRWRASAVSVL
jgi:hypothetical protein